MSLCIERERDEQSTEETAKATIRSCDGEPNELSVDGSKRHSFFFLDVCRIWICTQLYVPKRQIWRHHTVAFVTRLVSTYSYIHIT